MTWKSSIPRSPQPARKGRSEELLTNEASTDKEYSMLRRRERVRSETALRAWEVPGSPLWKEASRAFISMGFPDPQVFWISRYMDEDRYRKDFWAHTPVWLRNLKEVY